MTLQSPPRSLPRTAFKGDTVPDTVAQVLEREPDWSLLPADTPNELRQVLRESLSKSLSDRPSDVSEAVRQMQQVDANLPVRKLPPLLIASVIGAALLSLGAWWFFRPFSATEYRLTNPRPVTQALGVEDYPTWSPDGRTIAYESQQSGNWDIWITQIGTGQHLNRTADNLGTDRLPAWSRDGGQIVFSSGDEHPTLFYMSPLAGPPRRLAQPNVEFFTRAQWSPDGSQVAYHDIEPPLGTVLRIVSLGNGGTRELRMPGEQNLRFDLSWSRDGRFVS